MKECIKDIEVWKDIKGYEGLYKVSNLGNVKSLLRVVSNGSGNRTIKEKILKNNLSGNGYYLVTLCKKGKKQKSNIHQLVAIAFLNHRPDGFKYVVNHINKNKLDNNVKNLEIVTNRQNTSEKNKNHTSKYVGVCWSKCHNKWLSSIRIKGVKTHLGVFKKEIDAHKAYQTTLNNINA